MTTTELPKVSEMTFSIDDRVKIKGGRFKGLTGDVVAVKTAFLSVRMEGMPQLGKVAKKNCDKLEKVVLEMPSDADLVPVDVNALMEAGLPPKEPEVPEVPQSDPEVVVIQPNGVEDVAITMDDAYTLRDERDKLRLQVDSMLSFQANACGEIADLQLQVRKLKEELAEKTSVKLLDSIQKTHERYHGEMMLHLGR